MNKILQQFCLLFLVLVPVCLFGQTINGNNNTVIIQMQGDNNHITNSSINNSSNYRQNNAYSLGNTTEYFGVYSALVSNGILKGTSKFDLELYNDGSYRFIKDNKVMHRGTYSKHTDNAYNNTILLLEHRNGYMVQHELDIINGKILYTDKIILHKIIR